MQLPVSTPAATLDEEKTTAGALAELMQREQACLIDADIDGLGTLTDAKSQLVAQLATLTTARYQALQQAGHTGDEAGMQAWLKTAGAPQHALACWQSLLNFAQAAKELNRTNGLLIGKHMARNEQALNILRGASPANALYGPNGQSKAPGGGRGLVVG
jgi:flagella synthesis protein FlgN